MTIETVLTRMLDIYFSNVLIGLGWATAAGVFLLLVERHIAKKEAKLHASAKFDRERFPSRD